ncbi:MAG: cobyric acid synthase [Candidatus Omnitrophota bacterium]
MVDKKALQICGTGSGVGKSVIVSALCRIFLEDGYKVCPFKAQNMALNSFVTKGGGEIGRAQAVQAQACRIEPTVDMNPILIKPTHDTKAQIILRGRPLKNMSAIEYVRYKKKAKKIVLGSYQRLADKYDLVVIEGAGSPAEVNLKAHDIVNMRMAKAAGAPVILVGDIDKGGVLAWIVGTLELLTKEERKMIKGIIINKFRGDKRLLKGALSFLEKKTGIRILGVIPYFHPSGPKGIRIPEEDSVPLDERRPEARKPVAGLIDIAVISLPHMSNFTDFDALENEPDVRLRYCIAKHELGNPDLIIIPGTKNTIEDLNYLKKTGLAEKIVSVIKNHPSTHLIGICGGYQILGQRIRDQHKTESRKKEIAGLGLLPIVTNFKEEKILSQVRARDINSGLEVSGYEIHHGRTQILKGCRPVFQIIKRQGKKINNFDGASVESGRIWGTYIHGVFDEDGFRGDFLSRLRLEKGWPRRIKTAKFDVDKEFDKLARLVRDNIDMGLLYKIVSRQPLAKRGVV